MTADPEHILILAPSSRDAEIARDELRSEGVATRVCRSIDELCREIEEGAGAALLTEEHLHGAGRRQLEATLKRQPSWSDFPLLVLAGRTGPRTARNDRLRTLGNVTLLDRPLRVRTMLRAVHAALRARRRQYAAAREIDERDRFLAMLGHELRNPLSAIALAVEVATHQGGASSRELEVIEQQTQHLGRLVDDLLDVARVTAGKIVLQRAPVDAAAIVRRVAETMAAQFARGGIDLTISCDDTATVFGDEVRLEQVVSNLLTNALKYTPAGGDVRVVCAVRGGVLVTSVEDTGVGIAPKMLPRIFDAFAQAEANLARSQGGMGVGLTLVRTLVELHDGEVSVASEGVGHGTRFEVRLPLMTVEEVAAATHAPSSRAARAPRSLSIVLIDDHADSLELLAESLAHRGHRVTTAGTGRAGVDAIAGGEPDAAIVDIGLPDIDGYEVARRVREALGPRVRLIALSGYGQKSDLEQSAAAGFDAHLTKPANVSAVLRALDRR